MHCTTLPLPLPFSQGNSFPFLHSHGGLPAISPPTPVLRSCGFMTLPNNIHPYFLPLSSDGKQDTGSSRCGMLFLASLTSHFPLKVLGCPFDTPLVDLLPPQHCYRCITIFSQTSPLSGKRYLFWSLETANKIIKIKKFQLFCIITDKLAVKVLYYPQHPFLSQRVDCASARLRLTLISNSAVVLTFQRSLLLIHKTRSQICIMYSIKFNWIQ